MHDPSPSHDELLAYLLGEVDPARARAIEKAREGTPEISRELARLSEMLRRLQGASGLSGRFAVDAERLRSLDRAFDSRPVPLAERAARGLRDVIATIVFDSRRAPAIAGFRGVSAARIVRAAADDLDIEMRITYDDASELAMVTGTCRGSEAPDAPRVSGVAAVPRDRADTSGVPAAVDGEFFELSVPAGFYELRFERSDGTAAVIGAIELAGSIGGDS